MCVKEKPDCYTQLRPVTGAHLATLKHSCQQQMHFDTVYGDLFSFYGKNTFTAGFAFGILKPSSHCNHILLLTEAAVC